MTTLTVTLSALTPREARIDLDLAPLQLSRANLLTAGGTTESASRRSPENVSVTVTRVLSGEAWISNGEILRPIRARVSSPARDLFVVEEPATGIFGSGSDLPSAILDFREALVEHRDVLASTPALSAGLQEQLRILNHHLLPEK